MPAGMRGGRSDYDILVGIWQPRCSWMCSLGLPRGSKDEVIIAVRRLELHAVPLRYHQSAISSISIESRPRPFAVKRRLWIDLRCRDVGLSVSTSTHLADAGVDRW